MLSGARVTIPDKGEKRQEASDALTFGRWAEKYFADKADPKNAARLAERAFLAMCRQDGVKAALEAFKHTKQARKVHAFWRKPTGSLVDTRAAVAAGL